MPFARFGFLIARSAVAVVAMAAPPVRAADKDAPAPAIVQVAKATKACFADVIRVNGYLMPRSEAMVGLEMEG